jgi:hypothetical protein
MTLQDFLGWLLWNKKWGEIPAAPVQESESPVATDFLVVPITRPIELF